MSKWGQTVSWTCDRRAAERNAAAD